MAAAPPRSAENARIATRSELAKCGGCGGRAKSASLGRQAGQRLATREVRFAKRGLRSAVIDRHSPHRLLFKRPCERINPAVGG
jgi:hypothetical protein